MQFLTLEPTLREPETFRCSNDAYKLVSDISLIDRETCWCLHLDTRLHVIHRELIAMGNLQGAVVDARSLFRGALLRNTVAVILAHNHPSGDCTPSAQDITLTHQLYKAGEILGIELLDHIIVGANGYYSFADSQQLK